MFRTWLLGIACFQKSSKVGVIGCNLPKAVAAGQEQAASNKIQHI